MAKIRSNVSEDTNPKPIKWFSMTRSRMLWVAILGIPFLLMLVAGSATVVHFSKDLPSLEQLQNVEPRLITKIYDRNQKLVQEYFVEKRIWTPLDSISPLVPQAVMATEDRAFYSH